MNQLTDSKRHEHAIRLRGCASALQEIHPIGDIATKDAMLDAVTALCIAVADIMKPLSTVKVVPMAPEDGQLPLFPDLA